METKEEEWLRFIDTLNHELKTPLTSIIAAAGLLAEELESTGDESYQKLIQTIIHNANNLETRLAELLDIVKTGSGRLQLQVEPVDMRSLLQGIGWQISPIIQGKEQKLNMDLPASLPIIHGDGQRLEQVVLNLMTNATKFTPKGGNITLRARKQDTGLVSPKSSKPACLSPTAASVPTGNATRDWAWGLPWLNRWWNSTEADYG